ncbi:MAG: agmatinase [Chloroflexota bacterium]|nr:agmatinase [Chloroflexota bacterium]
MPDPAHDDSALPWNFLALPPEQSACESSRFLVLPVPYDGTVSYRTGAREGPAAIIDASRQMEDYDIELERETCALGIHTLPEVEPLTDGPEATVDRVRKAVAAACRPGAVMVTLGGEHSITVGAVRALRERHPDLSVLMLDAHADFRHSYQGSEYSHATVGRRIAEVCPLAIAGVRSLSLEEHEALEELGQPMYTWPQARSAAELADVLLSHLTDTVYVTIDLDVLDPSIMSAVGTPEPGGMLWGETLDLLRAVAGRRRIVGFDLMELAPPEGPVSCAYTAAKLAYKLMGYATLN